MGTEKRLAVWVVRDPMDIDHVATLRALGRDADHLGDDLADRGFDEGTLLLYRAEGPEGWVGPADLNGAVLRRAQSHEHRAG